MKNKDLQIKVGISLIFALIVWWFWSFKYPYALALQEELQCFLFDSEYFMERLTMPAGIARYLGEFIVQLYNKVVLGGFVIAVVYTLLHLATYFLVRKSGRTSVFDYIVCFLPPILLWWYMGDVKIKMTFAVALLLAELAMILCPSKEKKICKASYLIIAIPVMAWVAGPTALCLALYVALRDIRKPIDFISLATLVYAPACILASGMFAPIQAERLFYGVHYSLVLAEFPMVQYFIMIVSAVLPLLITFIPAPKTEKTKSTVAVCTLLALAFVTFILLKTNFGTKDYEVMKYDALVRAQKWDEIISEARENNPDTPITVASLNLALAMKGVLNQEGPGFFQNGWQGAFPTFNKQYMTSMMSAEVYFYLGMVNSAMRLDFEAQEALPDNAKSARLYKRLAETNLINGEYEAAKRYLKILQKTMFYRGWATRTMELLYNDKAIAKDPLYGTLRSYHLKKDFMFSETEVDKMMGQLILANPNNNLAIEYLLFLPRLEGNQQKEMMYLDFVRTHTNYRVAQ